MKIKKKKVITAEKPINLEIINSWIAEKGSGD